MRHRSTVCTALLALAVMLLASACLVTTPDGRQLDCNQVTETYTHRHRHSASHHPGARHPHPGSYLHAHTRQVWRCAAAPATTTTTAAPTAPTISVVGTQVIHVYSLQWTVDVTDPDTDPSQLAVTWSFSGLTDQPATLAPTGTPGRYTFTTNFFAYTSGTYTFDVADQGGVTGTVQYSYAAPPLCGSATGTVAPAVC